jgi:hypothetical protein
MSPARGMVAIQLVAGAAERRSGARRSATQPLSRAMRVVFKIALLLVVSWLCFEVTRLVSGHGEGVAYVGWFGALTLAGFLSAFAWPGCAVWGALLITWSQSGFVYWQLNAAGEIEHPKSSTGGMVAWSIVTFMLVMFSPVPALASLYGKFVRAKPAQQGAAAADRPQAGDRG